MLPTTCIDVAGVQNFRTIGNLSIENNRSKILRPDYLYRCGSLDQIQDEGIAKLKDLNIFDIFDLRSPNGKGAVPRELPGINVVKVSVFDEVDNSVGGTGPGERWGGYLEKLGEQKGWVKSYE